MDDAAYASALGAYMFYFGGQAMMRKRLSDALRTCFHQEGNGLRVLSIGPARGHALEDAIYTVGEEIKFERVDCVEYNSVMIAELKERIGLLAANYRFDFTVYHRNFSVEDSTAASFLPSNFYDLIVFNHVMYYFDDPGRVIHEAVCRLTRNGGHGFVCLNVLNTVGKICGEINRTVPRRGDCQMKAPRMGWNPFDMRKILIDAKLRIILHSTDEYGIALHNALRPARPCICEQDREMRRLADGVLSYYAQRDVSELAEEERTQIQNVIRRHTYETYGFPFDKQIVESYLVVRE
ncbi:uncharacterized protein LOC141903771 isoform X1 [Tubulanus polymorphus]|uniref:uncharacterized protein LOC141903771 isoform X1 n=1 Tax=Tubulanus polymorphus TaxID=672921 RepID=UPI003DA40ADA